jgi:2-dehydro-3-deoxygluconokinase
LAYLARLEALSPTAGDVPSAWRAVAKIDLASRVAARHRANAEVFAAAGARVILDPSPHCARTSDAPALRAMLPTVDALLASEGDIAALLARHGTPALAAEALRAAGFSEVVVKRGARGCEVATSAGPRTMPAPTTRMVDPTGAGDAFGGAFAAARAVGADMFPGAEAALRAGALAVGVASAADALDAAARATR